MLRSPNLGISSVLADLPLVDYRVTTDILCKHVRDHLKENPEVPGVLVVGERGETLAMISRRRFFERLSRPYALDVFLQRPMGDWSEGRSFLHLSGQSPIAEALPQVLGRGGELTYEPLVVHYAGSDYLLNVGVLLEGHARIFRLAMEAIAQQARKHQETIAHLQEQQEQIRMYSRLLEVQKLQIQGRSESLEAIQNQVVKIAELFANQGRQAFDTIFEGIDDLSEKNARIAQDSARVQNETLQIQRVGHVIREVAERINLLALNSSVEAERAGGRVRGLGLLAEEVRRLARETTDAARHIESMAQAIGNGTEQNLASARQGAQTADHLKDQSRSARHTLSDLHSLLQELTIGQALQTSPPREAEAQPV